MILTPPFALAISASLAALAAYALGRRDGARADAKPPIPASAGGVSRGLPGSVGLVQAGTGEKARFGNLMWEVPGVPLISSPAVRAARAEALSATKAVAAVFVEAGT
jgi:hypothetical protein